MIGRVSRELMPQRNRQPRLCLLKWSLAVWWVYSARTARARGPFNEWATVSALVTGGGFPTTDMISVGTQAQQSAMLRLESIET